MNPLVSICIPTYCPQPNFLDALAESIGTQRYRPIELIVSDDASMPSADLSALEHLAKLGSHVAVRTARNGRNLGMVGNWNAAVRASSGALVMLVGQDDVLGPGMVETYVRTFEAHPEAVAVSARRLFIDSTGNVLNRRLRVNDRERIFGERPLYVLQEDRFLELELRNGNPFGEPSAVMFRRKAFDAVGGYDPQFSHAADVDFNLQLSLRGQMVFVNGRYLHRRIHQASLTNKNAASGKAIADRLALYRKYRHLLTRRQRQRIRASFFTWSLRDAGRALVRFKGKALGAAIEGMVRFVPGSPTAIGERLVELATGKNSDFDPLTND